MFLKTSDIMGIFQQAILYRRIIGRLLSWIYHIFGNISNVLLTKKDYRRSTGIRFVIVKFRQNKETSVQSAVNHIPVKKDFPSIVTISTINFNARIKNSLTLYEKKASQSVDLVTKVTGKSKWQTGKYRAMPS